jgi:hypothetical protein
MGSTKAFRQPGATNSDGSKMISYESSITRASNDTNAAKPKPQLTIQEHLQDVSLSHWHQPIDKALDPHLHGHLTITNKTVAPDSWTGWPKNYCKAMLKLVNLVSAAQANELLTAKMAKVGFPDRSIGTQPHIIRDVVLDVRKRLGLSDEEKVAKRAMRRDNKKKAIMSMRNARGFSTEQRGGKKGKI